jgi:TolB-like protein
VIYRFEHFVLDTIKQDLSCDGQSVAMEPQVFALLELLLEKADQVVSKEELHQRIWGNRIVSDAAVNSRIRSARQAVNDNGTAQRLIRTVRNRGFRFVGEVSGDPAAKPISVPPSPVPAAAADRNRNPSIAILPLALLSLEPQYEPLADAISHEVIADLSRLSWLHVISRASTFAFRGDDQSLANVAKILSVDYVLSGTLALFDKRATVTVELSDTRDNSTLWADAFETSLKELIEVRRRLSVRIANAIEHRIQNQEARLGDAVATEDLDAWMSYFRGLRHAHRFNAQDNGIATQLFQRAVDLDPNFALAHSGLSFTEFQNAFVGYVNDVQQAQKLALEHAEQAFEIDQMDPIVNLMVGRAKLINGQWEQAGPWFERTTTISPNNAVAHYQQGFLDVIAGESSRVGDLTDRALSLSPIDPLRYAFLATHALGDLMVGNTEPAAQWAEQAANAPRAHHLIDVVAAIANHANGNDERAQYRLTQIRNRAPDFKAEHFFRSFPIQGEFGRDLRNLMHALGVD